MVTRQGKGKAEGGKRKNNDKRDREKEREGERGEITTTIQHCALCDFKRG